jgi:predicted ATPase/DNA-binding CsgD family transcriptional regulator
VSTPRGAALPLPPLLWGLERTPFVGRVTEKAHWEAAWKAVCDGGRTVVLVSGEPGIGKTRLVREAARRAYGDGAIVLVGRCTQETLVPYQAFVEALDHWVASASDADLSEWCDRAPALVRLLPRLADRGLGEVADDVDRWQLFEAVGSLLAELAHDRPVMLVLDDLHWVDRSSALLLTHLAQRAVQPRLALVGTYRSSEVGGDHPFSDVLAGLQRDRLVERIALDGLDLASTAQLVENLAGLASSAALGRAVHERTEGNPFFIEELSRHLADTGASVESMGTPEGVREVVAARLRLLSDDANLALAHGAVVGQQFDFEVMLRMTALDREVLTAALEEGMQAQLLTANSDPFSLSFAFTHALVRDTLYFSLSPPRRQEFHRRAAVAISSGVSGAAELAHHWLAARDLPAALAASVRAGAEATKVYAAAEALTHLEQALALWERVPDPVVVAGLQHVELLRRAAETANLAGDSVRARALIEQALTESRPNGSILQVGLLYERLGRFCWMTGDTSSASVAYDEAVRMLSGHAPSAQLARVLGAQSHMLMLQDRHLEAEPLAREAIAIARKVGDKAEEGYALCTLGTSLAFMGRIDEGSAYLEEARRTAESFGLADELTRVYICHAAVLLYEAGQLETAGQLALAGLAEARRMGVTRLTGSMAAAYAADSALRLGDWDKCDRLTSDPLLYDSPPPMALTLYLVRAQLEIRRGQLDEARHLLSEADRLSAGMPDAKNRGYFLLRQADLAVAEGRADDAREAVREGLSLVALADNQDRFGPEMCALGVRAEADRVAALRGRDRLGEAERARLVARDLVAEVRRITRLSLERGTVPAPDAVAFSVVAEAEYSRLLGASDAGQWAAAVTSWDAQGEPYPAAYARYRYTEALLAARRSAREAGEALGQALAVARSLGAALLVDDIERLAERAHLDLSPAPATVPVSPEPPAFAELGLTEREAEVLRLLAIGQTNRQIASALFISEKTASVHVSNILRKLDVRSRVEAGAVGQRLLG